MTNYEKAVRIAKDEGKVGIACLQRHLSISYEEAKRIIVQMKADGYISDKNKVGVYYATKRIYIHKNEYCKKTVKMQRF